VTKKLKKFAAPVAVLILAVASVAFMMANKVEPEKKENVVRSVSLFVTTVDQRTVTLPVKTQGEVRPKTEINLVSQVSGRVVSVANHFSDGGSFKEGETLIKIDDADYKFAVIRAEASVATAETQVALSEGSAEVARKQWDNKVVGAASALALKEPQLLEAKAKLLSAKADLDAAKLNLSRTNISVPFNGRVRLKQADIGQVVNVGSSLGKVFSTEVVEVRLPFSDNQFASLGLPIAFEAEDGKGPKVIFTSTVAGEVRVWTGSIIRTEAAVDNLTRMIYAVAQVEDPYGLGSDGGMPMAVGLFVEAEIQGETIENALIIPRPALRSGNKVLVVASDDTLDIRTVNVVYSDKDMVVLVAGLNEGERIVTSPVRAPRQGMKVNTLTRDQAVHFLAGKKG